jgi:hypothetical protein
LIVCLSISPIAYARDGLWISNKLTIGYGNVYTAVQVDIFQLEPPRTRLELGYIFEVHDNLNIVPRYRLQLPQSPRELEHVFGLDLKLAF